MSDNARIRVGIGGWTYEPWRETFYPADLPKKSELHFASRQVTVIEINGTFYRLQTPDVFAKWRDETPDGFVFTVKAPRHIVQRRALAEAGESIERFMRSGIDQLGEKLGAILWQLSPTKSFVAEEIEAFFKLLPATLAGQPLRHAFEVRHASFRCNEYISLARERKITTVYTHSHEYPGIADVTGSFVYMRLREALSTEPAGYSEDSLRSWATCAQVWSRGGEPDDLPKVSSASVPKSPRDVYVFFINGAKERAPAAARRLLTLLED
jgi:uncharacterized protein YecE (DUF72 family)